jgi:hypothetical protein
LKYIRAHSIAALGGALLVTAVAPTSTLAQGSATASSSYLAILVTTRSLVPKVQRTVGFNGFATYTFAAPRGRRIVSASARIVGAQTHAVTIRRRSVSRSHTRYTVSLEFPGEQGNPGKLTVRLGTVA